MVPPTAPEGRRGVPLGLSINIGVYSRLNVDFSQPSLPAKIYNHPLSARLTD